MNFVNSLILGAIFFIVLSMVDLHDCKKQIEQHNATIRDYRDPKMKELSLGGLILALIILVVAFIETFI